MTFHRHVRAVLAVGLLMATLACQRPPAPPALPVLFPVHNLTGPGIIRATAATAVRATKLGTAGKVWFPIPLLTSHQVPLTFEVVADPPEALKGWRWRKREDGVNWLCEADVAPGPGGATVRWTSLVLVELTDVNQRVDWAPLPSLSSVPMPEKGHALDVPDEAKPWLRSTACVQSADEDVARKAEDLVSGVTDVKSYVRNVIAFTKANEGRGKPFVSLDAKTALGCGGSCMSRANLAAALLRARGIPARTLSHLPTWSGPLYEHWLVEYWHPGAGWTWIEPSSGELRPSPCLVVVLNIANPYDEDEAFSSHLTWSGVMPGAARLSVHELSRELRYDFMTPVSNQAAGEWRIVSSAQDFAPIFEAAQQAYPRLAADARAGQVAEARSCRVQEAIAAKDRPALVAALFDDR